MRSHNVRCNKKSLEKRKVVADLNKEDRDARGVEGQIEKLDTQFGVGNGATKERARLNNLLTPKKRKASK